MRTYTILDKQEFSSKEYSLVPIRWEDRLLIMNWRNEQIFHLRQNKQLTIKDQDHYFTKVVDGLFQQEQPAQILFSFLKKGVCIGYGGLVHINWVDQHAELSFITATELEADYFEIHWMNFVHLISQVAFQSLSLHKIFTYAFDLRPHLYPALLASGLRLEAELKEHCFYQGKYLNVLIHSKWSKAISIRKALMHDLDITYHWATNKEVRKFAIQTTEIKYDEHSKWYSSKIRDGQCLYGIAEWNAESIGSIRLDLQEEGTALLSYLLDPNFHGKGFGEALLIQAIEWAKLDGRITKLRGDVFEENKPSIHLFHKLGFTCIGQKETLLQFELILI